MMLKYLKNLFLDNFFIKVISLFVAIVLWSYVNSHGGAEMDITVPLELQNVPARLVVVGDIIDEVNVRIKGRERVLQRTSSKSIHASLDLKDAREGDNVYFLDPSVISVPDYVGVIRINPQRIVIHAESLSKKDVPVVVDYYGAPAPGFKIGRVKTVPSSVTVEGPRSIVEPLAQLTTQPIEITGARANLVRESTLNLQGKEIQVEPSKPIVVQIQIVGPR
jgi:YbbR domain-containing protein